MRKIGLFLGIFLAALAAGAIPSEAQVASPTGQGRMQICGWQDDYGELLQSTHARAQNFRRSGSLWRGLARGSGRCDVFCPECGCGRGRQERARGQIHVVHAAHADKWTLILSKKIGEWGIPYPGEKLRFRAHGNESFQASLAARKLHDFLRSGRDELHDEAGLGNDSRFH